MSKDSSVKFYKDNKERVQYESFLKEENMVVNDTNIYHKMENKSWLKMRYYNYKKLFSFGKFSFYRQMSGFFLWSWARLVG